MEADLRRVKKLTLEQLSKVKTRYNAKLDPEVRTSVPCILNKPPL